MRCAGAKVKCLSCGDVIQSRHVHDFVTCSCWEKETGIAVDGGAEYLKLTYTTLGGFEIVEDGDYPEQHEPN